MDPRFLFRSHACPLSTNLSALLLKSCKSLRHVPSIAKLQASIRLDLSFTEITEITQGLEMLVNLKWLNLYAKNLMSTGKEIANLTHLQFMSLHWWSRKMKVKVEHISSMRKLETFAGSLCNMHHFNAHVKVMHNNSWPKSYLLQLDAEEYAAQPPQFYFTEVCFSKYVIVTNRNIRTGEMPLILPADVQCLNLEKCHDIRSLCDVFSLTNAASLRRCEIVDCDGQEYLLSLSCSSSCCTSLHNLESIELYGLKSLHILCKENEAVAQTFPPQGAFNCLRYFCIYHCPNIKKLLTPGMLAYLHNLEEVTAHNCESTQEIISVAATEDVDDTDYESSCGKQSGMANGEAVVFTHFKVSINIIEVPT